MFSLCLHKYVDHEKNDRNKIKFLKVIEDSNINYIF